jgi:uncharacterized membrane protein YwzB
MNPTPLFIVFLHLMLLPLVFKVLQYVRLNEIFKSHTPPNLIILMYFLLTIAMTQLVIGYFVTIFTQLSTVFN